MIKRNALVIGGTSTTSFSCKIIVETSPSLMIGRTKTILQEHRGISGALVQSNKNRSTIDKTYQIYLVNPSEDELNRFSALLAKEQFWLENEQEKSTRLWCYKVEVDSFEKDKRGVYGLEAHFICHPTRYFKKSDSQEFTQNGTLKLQGTALAYPKITLNGQSSGATNFTIGSHVIRLANLPGKLIMENSPNKPSFKTTAGRSIQWSGDFITLDPNGGQNLGVVLGADITSLTIETVWGWV